MDLYTFLVLALVCLSTTFAKCPDTCSCLKEHIFMDLTLKVSYCENLKYLPLDLITNNKDANFIMINWNNITVLPNIDERVPNIPGVNLLDLSNNHISKIEVNSLRVFNSLGGLYLNSNNISSIPDGLFKTLPHLYGLVLRHNQHLILPEDGFDIEKLENLNIAYCNLKTIPPKFFDRMPNIKFLFLENNQISYLEPNHVSHLVKMELVNLDHNNLTMFQPEFVTHRIHSYDLIILNDNPFRCDCNFKNGQEKYEVLLINPHDRFERDRLNEMQCVVPPETNNNNGSLNQEEFLKSLDCDVLKNKTESVATKPSTSVAYSDVNTNITSYNTSNESTKSNNNELDNGDSSTNNDDIYNNVLSTNHTALWIILGIVVVSVFFVVIVVIVRRQRSLPNNLESLSQLDLLQNEVEDV